MRNTIVLMTALLPTTGHADLIEFAAALPGSKTHVLISGRTFEPIPSVDRWQDLHNHFKGYPNVVIRHSVDDNAPQNPSDMPKGFWDWWKSEINSSFPEAHEKWDYVVASESYGQQVADSLHARFMPYDISRELNSVKGTPTRRDPWANWDNILLETRRRFMIKATMFGQESVGKTTLSKLVSEKLGVNWIHEYARPYLEEVGENVDLVAMGNIHAGQAALQSITFNKAYHPALILDTDLFSTVGYYRIMENVDTPEACIRDAMRLTSDVYYVLPDDIPFVPDILRYGGDHRESDTSFWIDLLDEFHREYVRVPSGSVEEKANWISEDVKRRFFANFEKISAFKREEETENEQDDESFELKIAA
jgi:HTH-type transcriptional repressor of NAD biosynthesis genes